VIGLRIHRRELHRRLADHFDPTEALVFLVFSVLLADAAHQPVAGPVEQGGGGAVLGGDRLRVERVPQFGGAVVEGKVLYTVASGPDSVALTSSTSPWRFPKTSPLIVTSSAMPAKVSP